MMRYDGRWGIAFLVTDMKIPLAERYNLIGHAIDMYIKKEKQRDVEGPSYEGRVYTEGDIGLLGSFAGQHFKAELDTDKGKANLGFLVTEYMTECMN